jgi:DeoR/GlpR family transcriptional regulator of sugar metabolism
MSSVLEKRRSAILDLIKKEKTVRLRDLVERFDVSDETIRRDLSSLERAGYLARVHGGATLPNMYGVEPRYEMREIINLTEKKLVARAAQQFIHDGDSLFIELGTTTLEFARLLYTHNDLIILTNSIPIADVLINFEKFNVLMIGGHVRIGDRATSGFLAEQTIDQFNVDKLIMGVGGVNREGWITDYHTEEANARRKMIQRSRRVIALADYSKFDVTALNQICPLSSVDILISDEKTPHPYKRIAAEAGADLVIAK